MEKHIKVYIDGIPSITDSIKDFVSLIKKESQILFSFIVYFIDKLLIQNY